MSSSYSTNNVIDSTNNVTDANNNTEDDLCNSMNKCYITMQTSKYIIDNEVLSNEKITTVQNNVSLMVIYVDQNGEEYVRMVKEQIGNVQVITLPGGKVEATDDTYFNAAIREYKEETEDDRPFTKSSNITYEVCGHVVCPYVWKNIDKSTAVFVVRTYKMKEHYSGKLNNGETNYVAWVKVTDILNAISQGTKLKYVDGKEYHLRACMKDTFGAFMKTRLLW